MKLHRPSPYVPHLWYAWHPVACADEQGACTYVWLESVWRWRSNGEWRYSLEKPTWHSQQAG